MPPPRGKTDEIVLRHSLDRLNASTYDQTQKNIIRLSYRPGTSVHSCALLLHLINRFLFFLKTFFSRNLEDSPNTKYHRPLFTDHSRAHF